MKLFGKLLLSITISVSIIFFTYYALNKEDTRWEDLLRELSYHAANKGFENISYECERMVISPMYKAFINADIAYALYVKNDRKGVDKLMQGKYFNSDSFFKRGIAYDIVKEPKWMKNLLSHKYLPAISRIKNEKLRLLPLYQLYLKTGEKEIKKEILRILNTSSSSNFLDFQISELLSLSLENNRPSDFLDFIKKTSRRFYIDDLIFRFSLKQENMRHLSASGGSKKDIALYLFYAYNRVKGKVRIDMDTFSPIKYYPCQYGYDYELKAYCLPLESYFAGILNLTELAKSLKMEAKSAHTIKKNSSRLQTYLPYAASAFASMGDISEALSFLDLAVLKSDKYMVLYSIIRYLPDNEAEFARFGDIVFKFCPLKYTF